MKHPHADKISQFARMVELGHHPKSLVERLRTHCNGKQTYWQFDLEPTWDEREKYRVASAFVEGRPVFAGDKLWSAIANDWLTVADKFHPLVETDKLFWNKPEQKHKYQVGEKLHCDIATDELGLLQGEVEILTLCGDSNLYIVGFLRTNNMMRLFVEEKHLSKPAKPKMSISGAPVPIEAVRCYARSIDLTFNSADDCNAFYQSILEGMKNAS